MKEKTRAKGTRPMNCAGYSDVKERWRKEYWTSSTVTQVDENNKGEKYFGSPVEL